MELNNVARVLNTGVKLNRHDLAQAVGAVKTLKFGRDYTGTGSSENDPIIFDSFLAYHPTFEQYCWQEGLNPATRRLEHKPSLIFDVLREDDREIWIKVPSSILSDIDKP